MPKNQITIPFFIANRGCPHRCVFCNQQKTSPPGPLPNPETIHTTIESYLKTAKPSIQKIEIAFFGGTFTGLAPLYQDELLRTAFQYKKNGLVHGIRVSTRPDSLPEEALSRLIRYGVTTVELGVQSFNDDVLALSDRGHTAYDSICASRSIRSAGMELVIQLMPGLPGDSSAASIDSARIASTLHPAAVRIYPVVIIKGTVLENLFQKKLYHPLSFEEAVEICKEMLIIFSEKNITVIRIGLHPLRRDEIDSIIAGPYHPAFGFFVKSRVKRDLLVKKIESSLFSPIHASCPCTIEIPECEKEEYIGHKRENIVYLRKKFGFQNIQCRFTSTGETRVIL